MVIVGGGVYKYISTDLYLLYFIYVARYSCIDPNVFYLMIKYIYPYLAHFILFLLLLFLESFILIIDPTSFVVDSDLKFIAFCLLSGLASIPSILYHISFLIYFAIRFFDHWKKYYRTKVKETKNRIFELITSSWWGFNCASLFIDFFH